MVFKNTNNFDYFSNEIFIHIKGKFTLKKKILKKNSFL